MKALNNWPNKTLLICFVLSISLINEGHAQIRLSTSSKWITGPGSCKKELHMFVNNTTNYTLDVWIAYQTTDGSWKAEMTFDARPNKHMMYWGCGCSGKWFYMTRTSGSNTRFPQTQGEIRNAAAKLGL